MRKRVTSDAHLNARTVSHIHYHYHYVCDKLPANQHISPFHHQDSQILPKSEY